MSKKNKNNQQIQNNQQNQENPLLSTSKKALRFLLINGVLWVWCSYILAFLDKMIIAETLSQVAITEILGAYLVYAIKALFENLSKNNKWPDSSKCVADNTTTTTTIDAIKKNIDCQGNSDGEDNKNE